MRPFPTRSTFEDVVRAAQRGDGQAIEILLTKPSALRRMIDRLKKESDPAGLARGWEPCPARGKADEAEAAARLGVLEALRGFDPDRGVLFTTYAYRFIQGQILSALYGRRRRSDEESPPKLVSLQVNHGDVAQETRKLDMDPDYGHDVGYGEPFRQSDRDATGAFVESLPAGQRQIVRMAFWEDLSQQEIAARCGKSQQAVSKSMGKVFVRARRELVDQGVAA